jgi:hypothetical protein
VTPIKKLDSSLFAASYVGYYEPNLFNLRKAPYLAEYIKTGASETAISEA